MGSSPGAAVATPTASNAASKAIVRTKATFALVFRIPVFLLFPRLSDEETLAGTGARGSRDRSSQTRKRCGRYALPMSTPEAKTSAPPRITCSADIRKLISKYL